MPCLGNSVLGRGKCQRKSPEVGINLDEDLALLPLPPAHVHVPFNLLNIKLSRMCYVTHSR